MAKALTEAFSITRIVPSELFKELAPRACGEAVGGDEKARGFQGVEFSLGSRRQRERRAIFFPPFRRVRMRC
jgi:hypothetical protein